MRVVGFWGTEEGLEGEECGPDGEGRRPLVLEDVQADGPRLARNVGMPNLGVELHLRGLVGILIG